jgi:hypothetical protein
MIDTIQCPSCQRALAITAEVRGVEVQCPSCKCQFQAGGPSVPPPAALPTAVAVELPRQPEPSPREADGASPGRRSQRRDPAAPGGASKKRRRVSGTAILIAGLAAAVVIVPICGGLGLMLLSNSRKAEVGFKGVAGLKDGQREWGGANPFNEADVARELQPLFGDLGAAFRDQARARIVGHFDAERMFEEFAGAAVPMLNGRANQQQFVQGMREGMANTLVQQAPLLAWTSTEFKQIKKLGNGEVAVIARHRGPDGSILKMRWWLTKREGTWRIYDFEDLDMGMRASSIIGSLIGAGPARVEQLKRPIQTVRDAALANAVQHDLAAAEQKLKEIEAVALPPSIDGLRWAVTASVQMQRGQYREAQTTLDWAHIIRPDMPIIDLLKGMCHNALFEYEKALQHLRAYEALLGDDSGVCRELGEALRCLNRPAEARDAYRKSLDYNPNNLDAFVGLLRSFAPGDARDDLGPRFAKLNNRRADFEILLDDCRQARDAESLTEIAQTMRQLDKDYASAGFALALAGAWAARADQAVPAFAAALALEKDAGKRDGYTVQFLQAMASAGLARQAYAAAPEPRVAFAILAAELKKAYRLDDLPPLVSAHAKKAANDPLLPFYRAEAHVQRGQYALADKAFAAAMAKPPEPATLDAFRSSRVLARYRVGQALAAYAAIGPRKETFQQLANLCVQDRNGALLATLLDARAKTDPDDADIVRYRCRLKIQQQQWADAVALFKAGLAKEPQQAQRKQAASDFVFAMLDAGKPLEGYQAAPDAQAAFQMLAAELLDMDRLDELRQLIDAHRRLHPADDRLALYTGLVHLRRQQWNDAVRVLGAAWRMAPANQRITLANDYVFALCKAGRPLDAYAQVEPRKNTFAQIAHLLIQDKKLADLDALIAAHRPHAGNDPDLFYFEARARALSKQPADALPLLRKAYDLQPKDFQRAGYVRDLMFDLLNADLGLEAYRISPDKQLAFETLASQLLFKKKTADLEKLLAEYGKDHAKNRWFLFYNGEAALLRGDTAMAERSFAAALRGVPAAQRWNFRRGLQRAQLQAGKVAEAYREASAEPRSFDTVADLCVQEKNAAQLAALIALHRQAEPDDPSLLTAELELSWLKQDYEGALKLLRAHREDLSQNPRFGFKYDRYLVRALLKLKRTEEAVREAEAMEKTNRPSARLLLILAHASAGDAKRAIAVAEQTPPQPFLVADCYSDLELGPLLRGEPMQAFRDRFPKPKTVGERFPR